MALSPDMSELSEQIMAHMQEEMERVKRDMKIKRLKESIGEHPNLSCRYCTHPKYPHQGNTLFVRFESGPERVELSFPAEMLVEKDMTVEDIIDAFRRGRGESEMTKEQVREAVSETTHTYDTYTDNSDDTYKDEVHAQEIEAGDIWDFTDEFYTEETPQGEEDPSQQEQEEDDFMTEEEKKKPRRAIERGLDEIDTDE